MRLRNKYSLYKRLSSGDLPEPKCDFIETLHLKYATFTVNFDDMIITSERTVNIPSYRRVPQVNHVLTIKNGQTESVDTPYINRGMFAHLIFNTLCRRYASQAKEK